MPGSARDVRHGRHGRPGFLGLAGLLLLAVPVFPVLPVLPAGAEEPARAAPAWQKEAAASGVKMDVRIVPLDRAGGLTEGELVRFEVGIQDAGTGTPLARLYPAAWMDRKTAATGGKAESCDDKLKMLLGGNLFSRAELDLNVYYVLALNDDATVSVVDPLFGYGGSKLLAMVELRSPGQDWALGPDAGRLFVSMPGSDAVAVVETHGWKVTTNVPTGPGPARLALQPDGAWLWVGHDRPDPGQEASGVSILQPASLQERARLRTGRGHHEIALSHDNQLAFVTNRDDGTVSIVDVRQLQVIKTLPAGAAPTSVAWCEAARTAYVSSEDGAITAIDGDRREAVARFQTEPGLGQIRCAPGGRLALAVNPKASLLHVIDTAAQRLAQTGPVGDGPDQISFSDTLAYIRHLRTDEVLMLPLGELGKPGTPLPVIDFPGGEAPPGRSGQPSLAPAIVRAAGASAVLVANPADGVIYYYAEGMAAPMGSFQNYGHRPRAALVVDNSLRERAPGLYANTTRLPRPGSYDLVVFLNSPRVAQCLPVEVAADPEREAARRKRPLQVAATGENLGEGALAVRPGEEVRLALQVTDPADDKPLPGLRDLSVMVMLAPGTWHSYSPARDLGAGRYEITFRVPEEGLYYLYPESPSRGLAVGGSPPLLYVEAAAGGSGRPGG